MTSLVVFTVSRLDRMTDDELIDIELRLIRVEQLVAEAHNAIHILRNAILAMTPILKDVAKKNGWPV